MVSEDADQQPLLREDRHAANNASEVRAGEDQEPGSGPWTTWYNHYRQRLQNFLSSKTQHYCVLTLVSLDLLGIFGDIFINLYTCEEDAPSPKWDEAREWLGVAGLVFSCLFMLELIMSIWAFGWRYFESYFHVFDGTVILAGFIVDVVLKGTLEEIASLVVILRLWRFFKIIEEFSVGAQEQMDGLEEKIEMLESENRKLKDQLVKTSGARDEEEMVGMAKGIEARP